MRNILNHKQIDHIICDPIKRLLQFTLCIKIDEGLGHSGSIWSHWLNDGIISDYIEQHLLYN